MGRPPAAPDEVVLDVATAQQHRVGLGDRVTVVTGAGAHELTVVGAVRHGDAPGLPDATVALLEPGTARQWFGAGA